MTCWLWLRSASLCFLHMTAEIEARCNLCPVCVLNNGLLIADVLMQTRRSTQEGSDGGEGKGRKNRQPSSLCPWPHRGTAWPIISFWSKPHRCTPSIAFPLMSLIVLGLSSRTLGWNNILRKDNRKHCKVLTLLSFPVFSFFFLINLFF